VQLLHHQLTIAGIRHSNRRPSWSSRAGRAIPTLPSTTLYDRWTAQHKPATSSAAYRKLYCHETASALSAPTYRLCASRLRTGKLATSYSSIRNTYPAVWFAANLSIPSIPKSASPPAVKPRSPPPTIPVLRSTTHETLIDWQHTSSPSQSHTSRAPRRKASQTASWSTRLPHHLFPNQPKARKKLNFKKCNANGKRKSAPPRPAPRKRQVGRVWKAKQLAASARLSTLPQARILTSWTVCLTVQTGAARKTMVFTKRTPRTRPSGYRRWSSSIHPPTMPRPSKSKPSSSTAWCAPNPKPSVTPSSLPASFPSQQPSTSSPPWSGPSAACSKSTAYGHTLPSGVRRRLVPSRSAWLPPPSMASRTTRPKSKRCRATSCAWASARTRAWRSCIGISPACARSGMRRCSRVWGPRRRKARCWRPLVGRRARRLERRTGRTSSGRRVRWRRIWGTWWGKGRGSGISGLRRLRRARRRRWSGRWWESRPGRCLYWYCVYDYDELWATIGEQ